MAIYQLIKSAISTTATYAIVSKTGLAAIPIGGSVIIIGHILQGKDNEASKFIGDVFLSTGLSTITYKSTDSLLASQKTNCRVAKENDSYDWLISAIPTVVSMIVSGTILSTIGWVSIPIGVLMVFGSHYAPGLAGEILYSVGSSIFMESLLSNLATMFTKMIGHKASKNIARYNMKTICAKFLISFSKIISFTQKLYIKYEWYFSIFKNIVPNILEKVNINSEISNIVMNVLEK